MQILLERTRHPVWTGPRVFRRLNLKTWPQFGLTIFSKHQVWYWGDSSVRVWTTRDLAFVVRCRHAPKDGEGEGDKSEEGDTHGGLHLWQGSLVRGGCHLWGRWLDWRWRGDTQGGKAKVSWIQNHGLLQNYFEPWKSALFKDSEPKNILCFLLFAECTHNYKATYWLCCQSRSVKNNQVCLHRERPDTDTSHFPSTTTN